MIHLILLAAGLSRRFGGNKLLFGVEGRPLYQRAISCAMAFQEKCGEPVSLILVTAYGEIEDWALLQGFGADRDRGVEKESGKEGQGEGRTVVRNRDQEAGLSHSISLGIQAANPERKDLLMFSVCDQPYLDAEELLRFYSAFARSGKGIGCMAFRDSRGNPVLFREKYKRELLLLTKDQGGKKVIREHEEDLFLYQTALPACLEDIDSREDLEKRG